MCFRRVPNEGLFGQARKGGNQREGDRCDPLCAGRVAREPGQCCRFRHHEGLSRDSEHAVHFPFDGGEGGVSVSANDGCSESGKGTEGPRRGQRRAEPAVCAVHCGHEAEGQGAGLSLLHDQQLRAWREGVPVQQRSERDEDDPLQRNGNQYCLPEDAGAPVADGESGDSVYGRGWLCAFTCRESSCPPSW